MATDIEMPDLRARVRFRMPAEWESHEATWIAG
jgi:agmatine/peptidylarginine deiminase